MSIPERFYRIARHKLGEIKDRIERWDEEAQADPAEQERRRKANARADARRELDDVASATSAASRGSSVDVPPVPLKSGSGVRASESMSTGRGPAATQSPASGGASSDPLEYHYRLLGVEPGMDFSTVQLAYNKLSARADPGRFPVESVEARQAEQIRARLEGSFKILRDALDPTARRFDLLEFDNAPAPHGEGTPVS